MTFNGRFIVDINFDISVNDFERELLV